MRILIGLLVLALLGVAVVLFATRPVALPAERFAGLEGDASAGERIYYAAGCASCHMAPESDDATALPGGMSFVTPFGTFISPNISPHPEYGIGGWTLTEFASAVKEGVSPEGEHYYPAFPYTTYARMTDRDVADLYAFMQGLPPQDVATQSHDVAFPFSLRETLGGWKLLHLTEDWVASEETPGRYLVEALGHCAECHTPRDATGGLDHDRWMAGAELPVGDEKVPGLTPDQFNWSEADIAYYLETGFTPEFDSAGGEMAAVVRSMARLSEEDRQAIAAYVKALPAP